MQSARALLANLTPRGRLVLGVSVLAVVFFVFLLFQLATRPSYTPVATGLDPAETGKITKTLDEKGVAYEVGANGTSVNVEKAQMADARIALAESGGVQSGKPGWELFDEQKLGASDLQQRVNFQRALEGELARTVGQVNGVSEASVQLTLPDDELFAEEVKPTTAAVLLNGGDQLDSSSVRGIARLVSSSVEGLKPENVTITDSTGALLWPGGGSGEGGGASKMSADNRYERDMEANLGALIAQTVGMGKGRVEVNADVDANVSRQDKLEYDRRGIPQVTRTETERLQGGGGAGGGATGTTGNIPAYAQGAGGGSNYRRQSEETTNALNKTVTRTRVAPGALNRQDVALVVDKSVAAADVRELRKAVTAAAGIDRRRRDTLTVSQLAFAKPPAPKAAGMMPRVLDMGKVAGLVLATLLFLFFSTRWLRGRQDEQLAAEPVWLRELESPTTLAELEQTQAMAPALSRRDTLREEVDQMAAQEPERVAQQVRAWMNEG